MLLLICAVVFINMACIFYTVGVWAERIQKKLKLWHVCVFWAGFNCDTVGTAAMGEYSGSIFHVHFHGITGLTAIILMLFHAIWATMIIARNDESMKRNFHKFSMVVWLVWLIPMVSGMVFGISR